MVIAILNYKKGLLEVEKHLLEHRAYLDKYYSQKKFVASGAQNPRVGGVILMNVAKSEAEQLIKEDPFYKNDIADYNLVEFSMTKCLPELESFAD